MSALVLWGSSLGALHTQNTLQLLPLSHCSFQAKRLYLELFVSMLQCQGDLYGFWRRFLILVLRADDALAHEQYAIV